MGGTDRLWSWILDRPLKTRLNLCVYSTVTAPAVCAALPSLAAKYSEPRLWGTQAGPSPVWDSGSKNTTWLGLDLATGRTPKQHRGVSAQLVNLGTWLHEHFREQCSTREEAGNWTNPGLVDERTSQDSVPVDEKGLLSLKLQ